MGVHWQHILIVLTKQVKRFQLQLSLQLSRILEILQNIFLSIHNDLLFQLCIYLHEVFF